MISIKLFTPYAILCKSTEFCSFLTQHLQICTYICNCFFQLYD